MKVETEAELAVVLRKRDGAGAVQGGGHADDRRRWVTALTPSGWPGCGFTSRAR